MKTAGIMIIVMACLGVALSFSIQAGTFITHGPRAHIGIMSLLYYVRTMPLVLIWIFVGLGFIAADNKLDKIANRDQRA